MNFLSFSVPVHNEIVVRRANVHLSKLLICRFYCGSNLLHLLLLVHDPVDSLVYAAKGMPPANNGLIGINLDARYNRRSCSRRRGRWASVQNPLPRSLIIAKNKQLRALSFFSTIITPFQIIDGPHEAKAQAVLFVIGGYVLYNIL